MRYISPKGPRKGFPSFLSMMKELDIRLTCVAYFLSSKSFFISHPRWINKLRDSRELYKDISNWSPGTRAIINPPRAIWRALIDHTTGSIKEKRSYISGRLLRTPRHILTRLHIVLTSHYVASRLSARFPLVLSVALIAFLGPIIVKIVVRNAVRSLPDAVRQASGYEWHSLLLKFGIRMRG